MRKIKIFVGCAAESLPIAEAVGQNLEYLYEITTWNHGIFQPGSTPLDDLIKNLNDYDYAVFIASNEDETISRGVKSSSPRDNVIFEMGMFISSIGSERVFLIKPRGKETIKLPSDYLGVNSLDFDGERFYREPEAAVSAACVQIKRKIESAKRTMSWGQFGHYTNILWRQIDRSLNFGGFRPHMVVGVNHGGELAASLFFYDQNRNFDIVGVRRTDDVDAQTRIICGKIKKICGKSTEDLRILLLDDSYKSGKSMCAVKEIVESAIVMSKCKQSVKIKCAAIVFCRSRFEKLDNGAAPPDYWACEDWDAFPYGSV